MYYNFATQLETLGNLLDYFVLLQRDLVPF